jgi:aspartyl protease family protein
MVFWLIFLLAILSGAFFAFQSNPELATSLMNVETGAIVVALALAFYVAIILTANRGPFVQKVRQLAVWAGLMLALIVGYSYRDEVGSVASRVVGNLMPPGAGIAIETSIPGERAVRIRKRRDGHFAATATVNGTAMTLMLDTGASTVVLKPADAIKAGIDVTSLSYSMAVRTANGTTYAAPVRIDTISIGPIALKDIEALVAKPGNLNESLLGMSFLRRLRSFDFSGEYVTLRG